MRIQNFIYKRLSFLFSLLLLAILSIFNSSVCYSQTIQYSTQIVLRTSIVTTKSANITASGTAWYILSWNAIASPATCSVKVDSSADGTTWNNGDVVPAHTCTSNGNT